MMNKIRTLLLALMLVLVNLSMAEATEGLDGFLGMEGHVVNNIKVICPESPKMDFFMAKIYSESQVKFDRRGHEKDTPIKFGQKGYENKLVDTFYALGRVYPNSSENIVIDRDIGVIKNMSVGTASLSIPNKPIVLNFEVIKQGMPQISPKMNKLKGYKIHRDEETYDVIVNTPPIIRFWKNGDEQHKLTCKLEVEFNAE